MIFRLYSLFTQGRRSLVGMAQWDEEWFGKWLASHPPPGVQLARRRRRSLLDEQEAQTDEDLTVHQAGV